jgi:hypothetical protein
MKRAGAGLDASGLPSPEVSEQITWGIIRYAAGSGSFPDEDAAGFDGWYADREDALAVAEAWVEEFPGWIVGLVQSDRIWFGQGDFSGWKSPLTERERTLSPTRRVSGGRLDVSAPIGGPIRYETTIHRLESDSAETCPRRYETQNVQKTRFLG